jgi:late competence protein required for DNA uptake (superfamily II DNA/RNA helicase)
MDNNYYQVYWRNRYQTDPVYREKKKKYELNRFVKKTIKCKRCNTGKLISYMKEIGYEYDKDNFYCPECHPRNCPDSQQKIYHVKPKAVEHKILFID